MAFCTSFGRGISDDPHRCSSSGSVSHAVAPQKASDMILNKPVEKHESTTEAEPTVAEIEALILNVSSKVSLTPDIYSPSVLHVVIDNVQSQR
jgi:hypothetical protein